MNGICGTLALEFVAPWLFAAGAATTSMADAAHVWAAAGAATDNNESRYAY